MRHKVRFVRWSLVRGRMLPLVAVAVLLLAACTPAAPTSSDAGSSSAEQNVELQLMCWDEGIGPRDLVVNDLIPAFEESHPNVTVTYETLPFAEYWTKIGAVAAAGNMPDIYCNSVAYLWDHANRGMSMNIQPLFDQDLNEEDYFMELTPVERYPDGNGDLYGFPIRWVVGALFYNKQLFDEAGLDYPTNEWTYDDVLEAAKQLTKDTDGDGETDQWGILANTLQVFLDSVIKSNGGQVLNDEYTQCMLTEPEALESIQWLKDLIDVHEVAPPPSVADGFTQGMFPSGRLAMEVAGSYQTAVYADIEDFEWDVAMQPQGTVDRVIYGGPDSLSISKDSENHEAAWEFLKYVISEEVQSRGDLIGLGSIPILKEVALSEEWQNTPGQPDNAQVFAESGAHVEGADFGSQWIEWRATIMTNELEQALLGQRSVEESAEAACAAIEDVLANVEVAQ